MSREETDSNPAQTFCRVDKWREMMRSLKIEELALVAGGAPGGGESTKKENNGLGNGDQTAPGGSFPNNKAENDNAGGTGGNGFSKIPN